jgi:hypothetical protein
MKPIENIILTVQLPFPFSLPIPGIDGGRQMQQLIGDMQDPVRDNIEIIC